MKERVSDGYDPTIAWLNLVLEDVGVERPLGALTNEHLRRFGKTLESHFFPGLPEMLRRLGDTVEQYEDISIEFYIVSSGLRGVVLGTELVTSWFKEVYACEFGTDDDGLLVDLKRCVTFTEKTRYLFEINKGIPFERTRQNPLLVNSDVPDENRRIPFRNMIYVGDGLTDIPCFSLVKHGGGVVFGVFDPKRKDKAKRALLEFLKPSRVMGAYPPQYGEDDPLGTLIDQAVATRCSRILLDREQSY